MIVDKESWNAALPNVMDCRFGRSNHSRIQYQFKYLESQMNYHRNIVFHFQLYQFEWIVIKVDSSIQIRLQNH